MVLDVRDEQPAVAGIEGKAVRGRADIDVADRRAGRRVEHADAARVSDRHEDEPARAVRGPVRAQEATRTCEAGDRSGVVGPAAVAVA